MDRERQIESLVTRVVAVVALVLLGRQVSGVRLLDDSEMARARVAHKWLSGNLEERARDALKDLELEPSSEDNKADLRKQLTRFLERNTEAVAILTDIIPDSINVARADTVIDRVGSALNTANITVGSFNVRSRESK